jgi:hypothetical protein
MTNYANENLKGFAAMWAAKIVMAIVEVATTINKALGGEDQAPNNNESKVQCGTTKPHLHQAVTCQQEVRGAY